jgi:hypothetical protein
MAGVVVPRLAAARRIGHPRPSYAVQTGHAIC